MKAGRTVVVAAAFVAAVFAEDFDDDDSIAKVGQLGFCTLEPLVDYDGNDVAGSWLGPDGEVFQGGHQAPTHETCLRGCLIGPECSHFSFVGKRCYYKSSDAGRRGGTSKFTISGACVTSPDAFAPTTTVQTTVETTPGDGITTTPDHTPCALMGVPGWYRFRNACYQYYGDLQTYDDAEFRCGLEVFGGHLASIHKENENEFIGNLQAASGLKTKDAWLGAKSRERLDKDGNLEWSWQDNTPFKRKMANAFWAPGEPNGEVDGKGVVGGGTCLSIKKRDNEKEAVRWNDANCLDTRRYFCKVYLPGTEVETATPFATTTVATTTTAELTTADDGPRPFVPDCAAAGVPSWIAYGRSCYTYTNTEMTFFQAEAACAVQVPNGHLASVESLAENAFIGGLQAATGLKTHDAWIGGITDSFTNEPQVPFMFTDGRQLPPAEDQAILWGAGEPSDVYDKKGNVAPGQCIAINSRAHQNHLPIWNDASCTAKKRFFCRVYFDTTSTTITTTTGTGTSATSSTESTTFTRSTTTSASSFTTRTATLTSRTATVTETHTDTSRTTTTLPTTTTPTTTLTTAPPDTCANFDMPDWKRRGNNCYKFVQEEATFNAAEATCRQFHQFSHLASIHSPEETAILAETEQKFGGRKPKSAWVGAEYNELEAKFEWKDGSFFTLTPWLTNGAFVSPFAPGEPSDVLKLNQNPENCIALIKRKDFKDPLLWSDALCTIRKRFWCKLPVMRVSPSTTRTFTTMTSDTTTTMTTTSATETNSTTATTATTSTNTSTATTATTATTTTVPTTSTTTGTTTTQKPTTRNPLDGYDCPISPGGAAWTGFYDACYIYMPTKKTFASARTKCAEFGGDIATAKTLVDNIFLGRLQAKSGLKMHAAWIGAKNSNGREAWLSGKGKWIDGTLVSKKTQFWSTGEPNSVDGQKTCLSTEKRVTDVAFLWNDASCEVQRVYFCKVIIPTTSSTTTTTTTTSKTTTSATITTATTATTTSTITVVTSTSSTVTRTSATSSTSTATTRTKTKVTTTSTHTSVTTGTSTTVPMPEFCDSIGLPGWKREGDSCYLFEKIRRTFVDAESFCQEQEPRSNIASVRNLGEMQVLDRLARKSIKNPKGGWLGAAPAEFGNGFIWLDETPFDYQPWTFGEPNNNDPSRAPHNPELCITTDDARKRFEGSIFWNDAFCGLKRVFWCKMSINILKPTTSKTTSTITTTEPQPTVSETVLPTQTAPKTCADIPCARLCTGDCGWSTKSDVCKEGGSTTTKEIDIHAELCPITTTAEAPTTAPTATSVTSVTTVTTATTATKTTATKTSETATTQTAITQTATTKTATTAPRTVPLPRDGCKAIKCGILCFGSCGWDAQSNMCVAGGQTSEEEKMIGFKFCPGFGFSIGIEEAFRGPVSQVCNDVTIDGAAWTDSDEDAFTCADYQTENLCVLDGNKFPNHGHVANTACCACGGGLRSVEEDCGSITCSDDCTGECGWSRNKNVCVSGGKTSASEAGLGECGPATCESILCSADCSGECGWSTPDAICKEGGRTTKKERKARLGVCANE